MFYMFSFLIIIGIIVTFINMSFAKLINPSVGDIFKLSLYLLPLQFLVGIGYAFYYSKGIHYFSYATLVLTSYTIAIAISIIASAIFFKHHNFSTYETLGLSFTAIGLFFLISSKFQNGVVS